MRYSLILLLSVILGSAACTTNQNQPVQTIDSPTDKNSHLPYLTTDRSGTVFLSWVETDSTDNQSTLRYAKLEQDGWSAAESIASSDQWFVNWADYPSILANSGEVIAAHTLRKIPGNTYSYNVSVYMKDDNERWTGPVTPHFDSTATEHGFVSMIPWNNQALAIWLDGRRTDNRAEDEYFDIDKAMTLRSAIIGRQGNVSSKSLIDSTVCDCCNTSLALTSEGPIAAYRNRTNNEIRDIYTSRFVKGTWSKPRVVFEDNWKIAACPVNGPAIAAKDAMVVVAWYTAADQKRRVKAALSTDYGETFSDPVIISSKKPIGRVDAVMAEDGSAYVSWIEETEGRATLYVKELRHNSNDNLSQIAVTTMDASRQSGFPRMALSDASLVFAWTHIDSPGTSVQTAKLPLADISELD